MSEQTRDKVFISYSHKDKEWLQKLETYLQALADSGKIIPWVDADIRPGDQWHEEIIEALETAKIAVLLVSENFLASKYITSIELPVILDAAKKKECTICWLLIRSCRYKETGLKDFQAVHDAEHPLETLSPLELNDTLAEIARKINRVYLGKQIKILSITASPDDAADIFYEQEQDTLLNAFQAFDRDQVYLDMPDPIKSTLDEIKERLEDGKHDILHITAHGNINDNGEGVLSFEDHRGKLETVTGSQLAEVLKGLNPAPVIVILSSCHSARQEPNLMPTARALFDAGIKTVIGMNKSISHLAAIEFNGAFFTALCRKKIVKQAFEAGKEAIFKGEQRRIKENPNWNMLKEYEIPQLLARDESLGVESFSDYRIEAPGRPQSHHFQGARYLERGFIGRRQVLRDIFRAIDNKQGAVVLKGPGGIGKSTLTTRIAANLLRDGYDFIIIRGDASEVKILEAISNKAAELGIQGAKEIYGATNTEPVQKLGWFIENFLGPRKVMIIFDNFEENQDEGRGDFGGGKESLKEFLWRFKDYLKNKESFLFFSTRYALPGFEGPDITKDIPEFTVVEFRKMLWNGKALKRLDGKSIKTLQDEIGGNPRGLELLDRIAYTEFHEREFQWEQLKDLIPELRRRIIEKQSESDDFTPLFLNKLVGYLTPAQRLILEVLSIYRNSVPKEAVEMQGADMARLDRKRLADLSLLECIEMEKGQLYHVHRLTAQYILEPMEMAVKNKYHLQAGQYFEGIRNDKGETYLENDIEARWHYLQAGEWNRAAEITFDLEEYLTLHGFPQRSMELLMDLDIEKLKETHQEVTYGRIATLYQGFGEYDKAIAFHQKASEIAQRNNDLKNEAASLHNIGVIYQDKGDFDVALTQYQKALEIREKIEDIKGMADSFGQIGMIYQEKGDYAAALTQYQKAKETFEKIRDIKGVAQSLHNIGMIYQNKGDYDAALTRYQKSLEIKEKIGDIKGEAQSLHQIGMIYQEKGDYAAALTRYQKSLEIKEKIGDIKGVATSLHQIGRIYQERGDYDAALTQYQKSLEIREKIGDIAGMAISMGQMGNLFFAQNQFEPALKLFIQAFVIFAKIGSPNANKAKKGISFCREKMPEERFQAILKEFGIEPKVFDPEDDETYKKMAMQFFSGITSQAVAASKPETDAEELENTRSQLTEWIDQVKDDPHQEPVKNYFQFLLAYVNKEDYQTLLQNLDPELKTIFENCLNHDL
ncbi:MAG: Tetratricopeptide repeat protein [Acidobacteriota bacterium]|nr:Tetratricopeptide repeat protein [Acidobacteriota bacterium]